LIQDSHHHHQSSHIPNRSFHIIKLRHLLFLPLLSQQVFAEPITWDQPNTNNNWNTTDANWTGGATYVNGDDAIFNAATGETVAVDAGGGRPPPPRSPEMVLGPSPVAPFSAAPSPSPAPAR
jgi:hypothetical protein